MIEFTPIHIETLVLVAVWERPFIFQGCFKLTDKSNHRQRLLFFRCESDSAAQTTFLDQDFCTHHYHFTHLYDESSSVHLEPTNETAGYALYILQYALHTTLQKMLTSPKQYLTCIDEVALQAISKRIKPILHQASWSNSNEENELGFAVAMNFNPCEESGQKAISFLLDKENPIERDPYALH